MPLSVTSAEFVQNVGHWMNEALHQPVHITHAGRTRLIVSAPTDDGEAEPSAQIRRGEPDLH